MLAFSRFLCRIALTTLIGVHAAPTFAAFTYDPDLHWSTLRTQHFNVIFHDGEGDLAQEVGAIAEHVHQQLQPFLNWQPENPTDVVLVDRMDFSNGSATPTPNNQMIIIVTPPDGINTLEDYDNWMQYLVTHEYTHVLHLDKANGLPKNLRAIFGRLFPWLFPNVLQPAWPIEGLATLVETDVNRGIGRGQSSTYQMYMRLDVENGIKPLRMVNQPIATWPAGTVRYLYGVYFMQFVRDTYGEQLLKRWIEAYSDNLIPFWLNTTSREVFGKDMDGLWAEFDHYLRARFLPQLDRIRANGLHEGEALTHSGYLTQRPRVAANGDVYYIVDDFESHPRLMRIPAGSTQATRVALVNSSRFDLHGTSGLLLTQIDAVRNTNFYSDLYRIDPGSDTPRRLTTGKRYRYATWSPDGTKILAVQNSLGNAALHLLSGSGELLDVLWQGTDKEVLGEPRFSPDGSSIVAAMWSAGQWDLAMFSMADRTWTKLTGDARIETQPQFTSNGSAIVYSADYGDVYNIRRIDLATHEITTLTNVRGGAFDPSLNSDQSVLYYTGVTVHGYDIFRVALNSAPTPPTTEIAATNGSAPPAIAVAPRFAVEDYSPARSLTPKWWFPYLFLSNEHSEFGLSTSGTDALLRHSYALTAAYDSKNRWFTGDFGYVYDRWNPTLRLRAARFALDYRNNADGISRIRYSDIFTAEAIFPFMHTESQWGIHAAITYDKEQDARIFEPQLTVPSLTDAITGIGLTFNSAERYPLSVSLNDGRQVRATIEESDLLNGDYSGEIATLDWREYFSLGGEYVLAFRGVAGAGNEHPRPFRLGGYFSEPSLHPLISPTDVLFNRRQFALRGYPAGLISLRGDHMLLASAEWRFPLKRIEYGYMAPPIGIHQLYGNVFFDAGEAWYADLAKDAISKGAGIELHTELVLGYWIILDMRAGYAQGLDGGGEKQIYITLGTAY